MEGKPTQELTVTIEFDPNEVSRELLQSFIVDTVGSSAIASIHFHDDRLLYRDSVTGRFVTKEETQARPDTTTTERS